jgi:hypothetical protein
MNVERIKQNWVNCYYGAFIVVGIVFHAAGVFTYKDSFNRVRSVGGPRSMAVTQPVCVRQRDAVGGDVLRDRDRRPPCGPWNDPTTPGVQGR